jgi:hypothetical protein
MSTKNMTEGLPNLSKTNKKTKAALKAALPATSSFEMSPTMTGGFIRNYATVLAILGCFPRNRVSAGST